MTNARLRSIGVLLALAACSAQTAPSRVDQAAEAAVLADSEIHYRESGGFAGRVEEARLVASGGSVTIEYRASGLPPTTPMPSGGAMDKDEYLKLWNEAARIGFWTLVPPKKSSGADLIESELLLRLGSKSHQVEWNDGGTVGVGEIARLGQRIFEAARRAPVER